MMEISELTALIMGLAPAISAVIGIIVSLAVGIKRIKHDNTDTINEVRDTNAKIIENVAQIVKINEDMAAENAKLRNENAELNKKLDDIACYMRRIHKK